MSGSKPTETSGALGSALENPILDIAASFWEDDRYRAFRVCYASMRRIDDVVDNLRSSGGADDPQRRATAWSEALAGLAELTDEDSALARTITRFQIPETCWTRLARAMRHDLVSNEFDSFLSFRRYAEGAAVAPAAVFIQLIGLSERGGHYEPAPVDPFVSARPMALFSYLTHILRDFRQDFAEGLEYIPRKLRTKFGVDDAGWRDAGAGRQSAGFTSLVRELNRIGRYYRELAAPDRLPVYGHLSPRYSFSLWLIWELYSQILERIAAANFELDPALITPGAAETIERIQGTAKRLRLDRALLSQGLARLGIAG